MRINTQQRQVTVPFSDGRGHFHTAFTRVWAPTKQLPDKASCRESIAITSIPNFCYSSIDFLTNTDYEADL